MDCLPLHVKALPISHAGGRGLHFFPPHFSLAGCTWEDQLPCSPFRKPVSVLIRMSEADACEFKTTLNTLHT